MWLERSCDEQIQAVVVFARWASMLFLKKIEVACNIFFLILRFLKVIK